MSTRIIVNGKEVTNPLVKALLMVGSIIAAALVSAVVIFVLLTIIGVAVALSVGFIVIFIVAALLSVAALALVTMISAWLSGKAEFRIERIHRRK